MRVVNKQFELLEFVSESVYVDLQYDEISLTFMLGLCVCCGDCDACTVVCAACVCAVRVTAMLVWVRGRCDCGECVYEWYTWFRCFV